MEASESYPMKGELVQLAISTNSSLQREAADHVFKAVVHCGNYRKLDITHLLRLSNSCAIADLGCLQGLIPSLLSSCSSRGDCSRWVGIDTYVWEADGMHPSKSLYGPLFQPLESCLVDMANEGLVNKDEIDKFNIPLYSPSATEISLLVQRNGNFSIAKLESTDRGTSPYHLLQRVEQA
ncbi:SAM dependent carboxyl methyltransferase [Dillenia turbinata]|uniref:SAM dependent carboxyl methyltransferase n=1 Tax=Dillenia turbinata TaxID=194707 RepID=A0AAN8Z327_9MAGN